MNLVKKYRFVSVCQEEEKFSDAKKEKYTVINNKSNDELGTIYFYPQWRQFVFEPESIILSHDCMADIQDFLKNHAGK